MKYINTIIAVLFFYVTGFTQKTEKDKEIFIMINGVSGDTLWVDQQFLCKCEKLSLSDSLYYIKDFTIDILINTGIVQYLNEGNYINGVARQLFCENIKGIKAVYFHSFHIFDRERHPIYPTRKSIFIKMIRAESASDGGKSR